MKANFAECLRRVLVHEGGYVNHPKDPGGETNKGITQATYTAWLSGRGKPFKSVKHITDAEVSTIYKVQYWDKVQGDDLPSGVDYAVFDFAVNSGVSRAAKFLQRELNIKADGVIGQHTLAAVKSARVPAALVRSICDSRLAWLKRLKGWATFGKGWSLRVAEVRSFGIELATEMHIQISDTPTLTPGAGGKADGEVSASISDLAKDPKAWGAIGGLLGSAGTLTSGDGPIQWAIAALLVIGGLVAVYMLVKRNVNAQL